MKSIASLLTLSLVSSTSAFSSNYLSSLSPNAGGMGAEDMAYNYGVSPPPPPPPSSLTNYGASYGAVYDTDVEDPPVTYGRPYEPPIVDGDVTLHHAKLAFFHPDKLTPKGPRTNADVGDPEEAERIFLELGKFTVGSWTCSPGGWRQFKQKKTTEVFFVLSGKGCVTDLDGIPHEFGPGDVVVLPKGWSGRFDVLEDLHKIYFDHAHVNIEEAILPVRAVIRPYEKMVEPQYLHPGEGGPGASSRLLYSAGPTTVASVMCAPGSSMKVCYETECFHLVEGVLFLTTPDGTIQRFVAGDTVVLPPGWSGHHDVVEKTTMLWISVEEEEDVDEDED
jgi:uncharacterized cupin superfamily protein